MAGGRAAAGASVPVSSTAAALDAFIAVGDYPCLGAKAALARRGIEVLDAGDLVDCAHDEAMVAALQRFARHVGDESLFVSFAVAFAAAPALTEQDFGAWEGISHDTAALRDAEAAARFWRDPARQAPPGGESFATVMERTAAALRRLTDSHAGRDLVAVIHAGSIRSALALALDLTPEAALRLRIDPWSLTRIDHHHTGTGSWSVGGVNQQAGTF